MSDGRGVLCRQCRQAWSRSALAALEVLADPSCSNDDLTVAAEEAQSAIATLRLPTGDRVSDEQ